MRFSIVCVLVAADVFPYEFNMFWYYGLLIDLTTVCKVCWFTRRRLIVDDYSEKREVNTIWL